MVRWSAIPFSLQDDRYMKADRYMLRNTLLTVSVFVATAACGQAQTPAAPAAAPAATGAAGKLYTVVEGYKVDAETMKGFRAWRAAACDRCHGANQEGMVGPSLVTSLKTLTKEEFVKTVRDGRLEKGMQSFGTSPQVMENMNQLYAYLKGRSDGAITRAKVEPMP
jgi:mono/diheme cytochrome c family protein